MLGRWQRKKPIGGWLRRLGFISAVKQLLIRLFAPKYGE